MSLYNRDVTNSMFTGYLFKLEHRIKIEVVESMKSFPFIVSMIIDVIVDDEINLPECFRSFLNFLL